MKYTILLILCLMIPAAYAADFSQGYFSSESGDFSYMGSQTSNAFISNYKDGYMLRSTNATTDIDIAHVGFAFCDSALSGSDFYAVPINLADSVVNYEHYSMLRPYSNYIVQMTSDCSVLDRYNLTDMTIISQLGSIRGWKAAVDSYTPPNFAVLAHNTSDDKIYAYFFTLNNQSEIELQNRVYVYTAANVYEETNSNYYGMVGGCYSSQNSGCTISNRVFGFVYHRKAASQTPELYTFDFDGEDWVLRADGVELTGMGASNKPITLDNGQLFFDDLDNNGWNEFIHPYTFISGGAYIRVDVVQPVADAPYYNAEVVYDKAITGSLYAYDGYAYGNFQGISLCQMGDKGGTMEICGSFLYKASSTDYRYYNFFYDPFFDYYRVLASPSTTFTTTDPLVPMFSMRGADDVTTYMCAHQISNMTRPAYTFDCFTFNENTNVFDESFIIALDSLPLNGFQEVVMAELDGNSSNFKQLMFASGEVFTYNGTDGDVLNYSYVDDLSPAIGANSGTLQIADLNGDDVDEIIFASSSYTRIFSMENTAWVLEEYTGYIPPPGDIPNDPPAETETGDNIFETIQTNSDWLFGIVLIILCIGAVASFGVTSPAILIFAGILGAFLAVGFGLFDMNVIVIIVVSLVILLLLSLTIFKGDN